jgi:HlyD family secretion protein
MNRRTILLTVGGILALAVVAVLWLAPRAKEVPVLTVRPAEAVRALAVNGRIRPRLSVDVKSPVAGTLIELSYDVGDRVARGAPIARIDDGPQRAAIAEAAAAVAAQEAVVAQARRDLARYRALGEFVTRQRVEQARLAVESGARELQRLRAATGQAREVQARSVIRAPFAGVIMDRPVDRGQAVSTESVLYRLADLTEPEIAAQVDEEYAAELGPGTAGVAEVAGQPRPLRVSVAHVEPLVDEGTGAREVRLRFVDPVALAPAGQTVSVNLVVERRKSAISVPRAAILQPEASPRVRVLGRDGRVAEKAIRFIDWPADQVIVTSGLAAGERVVLDPAAVALGDRAKPAG